MEYPQKTHINKGDNDSPKQEEDSAQKEIKENVENQQKYYSRDHFFQHRFCILLVGNKFYIANTCMNVHPFIDDILQPPELV
jgi:hypothetical protein